MRTNKKQQTKKALLDALEKSLGIVTTACKIVGVDRGTFYRYYNEDENFKKAVKDIENVSLDFAETKLLEQIKSNNTAATIFYLKTRGKHRGYIEKQQIEHSTDYKFDFGEIKDDGED